MAEQKEQWNMRIKPQIADAMRAVRDNRINACGEDTSLRDLTEEAFTLFCKLNGVKVKEAA